MKKLARVCVCARLHNDDVHGHIPLESLLLLRFTYNIQSESFRIILTIPATFAINARVLIGCEIPLICYT